MRIWEIARSTKNLARTGLFAVFKAYALARPFRLVVVIGLKRSGNHVFINWLQSQSTGPCLHWNCVDPAFDPTLRQRRSLRAKRLFGIPTVIFSYEDHDMDSVFGEPLSAFIADHKDLIRSQKTCLILRDPRNLMASRFKKWPSEYDDPAIGDRAARLWTGHAQQVLEQQATESGHSTVPVYYNVFVTSPSYRSNLSRTLGINVGDRGLSDVPDFGHGSSFDGMGAQGEGEKMDTFNRWRTFADDARFLRLFENGRLEDLDLQLARQAELSE